jgi:hypothetical protein
VKSSENWNFYALRVDGSPASNCVDIGVADAAPVPGFGTLSFLSVKMNMPRPDGLSSNEEFETLSQIESTLQAFVDPSPSLRYVGRSTHDGGRDFFFYSKGDELGAVAEHMVAAWPGYEFSHGSQPDPDWGVYWRFLYPSAEDFQRMGNRDVLEQLRIHGDDHAVPREIDHYAVFEAGGDVEGFMAALPDTLVGEALVNEDADGTTTVAFKTFGCPADIDDLTIDLFRAAKDHGGDYDGWGCVAVPSQCN